MGVRALEHHRLAAARQRTRRRGELALGTKNAPTQGRCVAHLPLEPHVVAVAVGVEMRDVRATVISEQVHERPSPPLSLSSAFRPTR